MKRIMRHAPVRDPDGLNVQCAEKACLALSAVLLYPTTHEKMAGEPAVWGFLRAFILLCRTSKIRKSFHTVFSLSCSDWRAAGIDPPLQGVPRPAAAAGSLQDHRGHGARPRGPAGACQH